MSPPAKAYCLELSTEPARLLQKLFRAVELADPSESERAGGKKLRVLSLRTKRAVVNRSSPTTRPRENLPLEGVDNEVHACSSSGTHRIVFRSAFARDLKWLPPV